MDPKQDFITEEPKSDLDATVDATVAKRDFTELDAKNVIQNINETVFDQELKPELIDLQPKSELDATVAKRDFTELDAKNGQNIEQTVFDAELNQELKPELIDAKNRTVQNVHETDFDAELVQDFHVRLEAECFLVIRWLDSVPPNWLDIVREHLTAHGHEVVAIRDLLDSTGACACVRLRDATAVDDLMVGQNFVECTVGTVNIEIRRPEILVGCLEGEGEISITVIEKYFCSNASRDKHTLVDVGVCPESSFFVVALVADAGESFMKYKNADYRCIVLPGGRRFTFWPYN